MWEIPEIIRQCHCGVSAFTRSFRQAVKTSDTLFVPAEKCGGKRTARDVAHLQVHSLSQES